MIILSLLLNIMLHCNPLTPSLALASPPSREEFLANYAQALIKIDQELKLAAEQATQPYRNPNRDEELKAQLESALKIIDQLPTINKMSLKKKIRWLSTDLTKNALLLSFIDPKQWLDFNPNFNPNWFSTASLFTLIFIVPMHYLLVYEMHAAENEKIQTWQNFWAALQDHKLALPSNPALRKPWLENYYLKAFEKIQTANYCQALLESNRSDSNVNKP